MTFDPKADAAYIELRKIERGGAAHHCPVECEEATGMIVLDLDRERRLIGIDVLGASNGLPIEVVAAAERIQALELRDLCPVHTDR